MTQLQAWLVVGIPGLVLAAGLLGGRTRAYSFAGYGVLAATFLFFLLVADDAVSAGVVGTVIFLLVAVGRGQQAVEQADREQLWHDVPSRVDDPNLEDPRRV
ncbi:MAG: hypothetical protein ACRDUY_11540 [Nitriliruptorales bacterium]